MSHRRRAADNRTHDDEIYQEKRPFGRTTSSSRASPIVIISVLPWASATLLGCTRRTVRCRCLLSSNTWPRRRPRNRRHRRLPLLLLRCRLRRSCRNNNLTRCCCHRRCCRKRPRQPPCTTRYRRYRRRYSFRRLRRRPYRCRWASCSPDIYCTRNSKIIIITITRAPKTLCCLRRHPRRHPCPPQSLQSRR